MSALSQLQMMFPNFDAGVMQAVLASCNGSVEQAISSLLAMSGQQDFGAPRSFSSSSQDPRSGHAVDKESVCSKEHKMGKYSIQVRCGDMTKEKVDVIVNAANKHLDHASGLAGAIVKKGGQIIQDESDIWLMEHGKVPEGDLAITTAGTLPSKKVFHAVGPMWHGGADMEMVVLRQCVWKSLVKAEEMGYKSISVPAISSGIFRFPKELCAEILFETAEDFFKKDPKNLIEIRFTNFDEKTVEFFEKEFHKRYEVKKDSKPATDSAPTTDDKIDTSTTDKPDTTTAEKPDTASTTDQPTTSSTGD